MTSIKTVRASNAAIDLDKLPRVAVFVGATSGIGKATLSLLLSKQTSIKVYIVGRNQSKNAELLDAFRQSNSKAEIVWIEAQVSLMAEVKRATDEIKRKEKSIDLLVQSAGIFPLADRTKTSEGLDLFLALGYYSKVVFLSELLPLLQASTNNPRAITILGAGEEDPAPIVDDYDLEKPENYSLAKHLAHSGTGITLAMQRLAAKYPDVTLIHTHPGLVSTDLINKALAGKTAWWTGIAATILSVLRFVLPLFWTVDQAAERELYVATTSRFGGKGAAPLVAGQTAGKNMDGNTSTGSVYVVGEKLEALQIEKVQPEWEKSGAADKLWRHTVDKVKPFDPDFA
jgi:NAD(P)-dependent dehydrogenase (short-subunit alcohol dehydrogenase family)